MLDFFNSAPVVDRLPEDKIDKKYKEYRIRMFLMIFIGYAGYYLVRKNFALAAPYLINNLGFTKTQIGLVGTGLAVSYGLSKFFLGNMADKCNVKYFIGCGLLCSALANMCFCFTTSVSVMFCLMLVNGIFQGMGAPSCSIVIAKWFSTNERGIKMGFWNISHNIGGGSIAPLVSLALLIFGAQNWKSIFYFPAIISIIIAFFVFSVGADTPESEGLPSIEEYRDDYAKVSEENDVDGSKLSAKEIMIQYVLKNKYVWYLALANAFVYLIRYGVIDWVPVYLTEIKHFSPSESRWSFFLFEYAAIPGSILMGWLSDKVFHGKRAPLGIICMIGVVFATIIYWKSSSIIAINVSVALIGILVYGPQLLIGMNTIDIVPKFAVGTAVGFTGLFGYLGGELIANLVMGAIVDSTGWDGGFMLIIGASIFAIGFLVLTLGAAKQNKKQETKIAA